MSDEEKIVLNRDVVVDPKSPKLKNYWDETLSTKFDPNQESVLLNDTLGQNFKTDINLLEVVDFLAQDKPNGDCSLFIADKDKKNIRCINKYDCINISHTFLGLAAAFIEDMKDIPEEKLNEFDKEFKEAFDGLSKTYDKVLNKIEKEEQKETDKMEKEIEKVEEPIIYEFTSANANSLIDTINAEYFIPNDVKLVDLQDTYNSEKYTRYKLPAELTELKYDIAADVRYVNEVEKVVDSIKYQLMIDSTRSYAVLSNKNVNFYNRTKLQYSAKIIPFIKGQTTKDNVRNILKDSEQSIYKHDCDIDFYSFMAPNFETTVKVSTSDKNYIDKLFELFNECGTDYYDVINFNNENHIRIIKRNDIAEEEHKDEKTN